MKRFMIALLAGAMMLATASFAAAEVTVGGAIETRYDLWKNIDLNGNGSANFRSINFFESRILLNVDAKITEGLEGFVELDTDNDVWGNQPGNVFGVPTYLNHLNNPVFIRQGWVNFMVPGLPVGVKIGHQPLALGHGIWLDTSRYGSDAILVYSMPAKGLLIAGAYVQGTQYLPTTGNWAGPLGRLGIAPGVNVLGGAPAPFAFKEEANFYAALANYTWMENNTVGMNFTYVTDKSSLPASGINAPIWATNTALVLDGAIANVNYKGEVDWLFVKTDSVFGEGKPYDVNAFAAMLGASTTFGPVNAGLEVAYGTGNDDSDPNIFYNPGMAANGKRGSGMDHAYYTPYDSTSYNYAFLYNDKIGQGPLGAGGGAGFGDGFGGIGLANTGYVKLSVGVNPTDKLKIGVDGLYLRASETMIPGQSKDLGWEVDANASYKLYDNLVLSVTGGVFDPGAWYAFQGHALAAPAMVDTLTDETDLDSPIKRNVAFGMETKLVLKF